MYIRRPFVRPVGLLIKTCKMSDAEMDCSSGDEDVGVADSTSKKAKFGAFKSIGLSPAVLKGILRRGYRLPTPIQRRSIPHILSGRDIVGMSRTGSGKTAAFLVPLFEKLKRHLPGSGPRALIMTPTRDLALQTSKFVKELGKFTDLRTAVIIGGDRLEDQFTLLHSEPDILIVTPGRLLHIMVEMELKLSSIVYLVFDEADRLFELGFSSQVSEILSRTSKDRQTLLFSATLPAVVAEFVAAGLHNPKLVRLDVESKLSPQLTLRHLLTSSSDKLAVLLYLVKNLNKVLDMDTELIDRQATCVVFVATKYHADYIHNVLVQCGVSSTYAYSSMDPTARKINMAKFRMGQASVLIVTDVAARGIDIPELDAVVNFNFPSKPKLFVHRVGRVARAGRCGMAFSLLSTDEVPYLIDLNLFLGKSVRLSSLKEHNQGETLDNKSVVEFGSCPRVLIDSGTDSIAKTPMANDEQSAKAMENASDKYLRLRPSASPEAVRQAKKLLEKGIPSVHSMFAGLSSCVEELFLAQIRQYKPKEAFMALASTTTKHICNQIAKVKGSKKAMESDYAEHAPSTEKQSLQPTDGQMPEKKPRPNKRRANTDYFVPYVPSNHRSESELRLSTNNNSSLAAATLDIADDERLKTRRALTDGNDKRHVQVWHRKAKKFVNIDLATKSDGTVCRVKSEATGKWIPKSFKSKKYEQWKRRNISAIEAQNSALESHKGGIMAVSKRPDYRNRKKKGKVNKGQRKSASGRRKGAG